MVRFGGRLLWRRVVVVGALVAGVAPAGAQEIGSGEVEPPEWADEVVESTPADDPVAPPVPEGATSAPLAQDEPLTEEPTVVFPAPGVSELTLGAASSAAVEGSPISIEAGSDALDGAELAVEVMDPSVAQRAGVSGFVFEISGAGGVALEESLAEAAGASGGEAVGAAPVSVALDYSGFAQA